MILVIHFSAFGLWTFVLLHCNLVVSLLPSVHSIFEAYPSAYLVGTGYSFHWGKGTLTHHVRMVKLRMLRAILCGFMS